MRYSRKTPKSIRSASLVILAAVFLSSCGTLANLPVARDVLSPDVKTDIATLKDGNFSLDPAHAYLDFSVRHMGLSDLKGRFDRFEISLRLDPDVPENSLVQAEIDMNSLFLATPEFSETLKGADWFNAAAHPNARFRSSSVTRTSDTTAKVIGTLDLNGRQGPVSLDVTYNGGADIAISGKYTVGFNATGVFSRSDFGLGQYVAFVSDDVTLSFSGEFHQVDASS